MVATQTRQATPWRLTGRWRKATLLVHMMSALGWLGADVVLLILAVTGLTSDDRSTVAACYQAMGLFVVPTLLTAGLLCLATGVLLGLSSRYGLLKYWWVATKLAINLVLTSLVLVLLQPRVDEAARLGRGVVTGLDLGVLGTTLRAQLIAPPIVSITALTFAAVLAVYKPWGRLRRGNGRRD